ncbi:uncharacterized protein LOC143014676 isoform X1 [Genypterus blacodes]
MPVSRMRMRPWLEEMIESSTISGLRWIDTDKTQFSIPWKHAARHGWELDKDASLFKKWAIHTGKYTDKQEADPKTWKANFRCAMNSLPDIEEVKNKSVNKGHQAVRVYKLLPVSPKAKDTRRRAKERKASLKSVKSEDTDDSDASSPSGMMDDHTPDEDMPSPQENTVDSTENSDLMDTGIWSGIESEISTTFTFNRSFEVSPSHSIDDSELIRICEEIQKTPQAWVADIDAAVYSESPESCCLSDTSSDQDESPQYTYLGSYEDHRYDFLFL